MVFSAGCTFHNAYAWLMMTPVFSDFFFASAVPFGEKTVTGCLAWKCLDRR